VAADCFHCNVGSGTIPGTTKGAALGCCRICHVLACQAHGSRDPTYPRWICVACDSSLLAASGAAVSQNIADAALLSSRLLRERDFYRTLDAFLLAHPEFESFRTEVPIVQTTANQRLREGPAGRLWKSLSIEGKRLLAAAILIADRLQLRHGDIVEGLRLMLEEYNRAR
jgi:hypothetical protein